MINNGVISVRIGVLPEIKTTDPGALKGVLKDSSACLGREQRTAVITTEGCDEMALPGVVTTLKPPSMSSA